MSQIRQIIQILSDGNFHSGEELGALLGVSRSAVWQTLKRLLDPSMELHAVRGRGYRLADGFELLEKNTILTAIADPVLQQQVTVEIHDHIPSTNSYLLTRTQEPAGLVCLAEQQTQGRGRRGKQWHSVYGKNIALSLLWHFPDGATSLAGLSLVIGIAVANVLERYGIHDVALKWPNDLVYHTHKLGGILIELSGDAAGPCQAIIGIGLNLDLQQTTAPDIKQAWTDIRTITGTKPQRNRLIGLILRELLTLLPLFTQNGFAAFLERWQQLDALYKQEITLYPNNTDIIHGIAHGVDRQGNLLVEVDGKHHTFHSAEVSVRLQKNIACKIAN